MSLEQSESSISATGAVEDPRRMILEGRDAFRTTSGEDEPPSESSLTLISKGLSGEVP